MRALVVIATTLAFLAVTATPRQAAADHDEFDGLLPFAIAIIALPAVGGAVSLIGNASAVSVPRRPGTGWLVVGYIFGPLNLIGGAALLNAGGSEFTWADGVGLAGVALGAATLGVTIYGTTLSRAPTKRRDGHSDWDQPKPRSQLTLGPALLRNPSGGTTPGVALTLMGF